MGALCGASRTKDDGAKRKRQTSDDDRGEGPQCLNYCISITHFSPLSDPYSTLAVSGSYKCPRDYSPPSRARYCALLVSGSSIISSVPVEKVAAIMQLRGRRCNQGDTESGNGLLMHSHGAQTQGRGSSRDNIGLLRRRYRKMSCLLFAFASIAAILSSAWVDRTLPTLPPLPQHPKRASATLYTESNACYDMALLVLLASWNATKSTTSTNSSSYPPMLILYSTPSLPEKVSRFIDGHPLILARKVKDVRSYIVRNRRWRKCATKFAIWDQTDFDQIAYYDSDHMFRQDPDTIFSWVSNNGDGLLYAQKDQQYGLQFNAGRMLVRPSRRIFDQLHALYNRRFWIMNFFDIMKSGDQRFLNAVFARDWQALEVPAKDHEIMVHSKVWKHATFKGINGPTQSRARAWIDQLGLHEELKTCMKWRYAYGNYRKERANVEYWF